MLNLVLYSDQIIPANEKIDWALVELMDGRGRRIGYIPSGPDPGAVFYSQRQVYYARYGLTLDTFFDLDCDHSDAELAALFACDAIHLSGGDTAAFLARLRRNGILEKVYDWASRGGILIGTSAGSILMTPTIAVDAIFSDRCPLDVKDGAALNLVSFEFFAHLHARPNYLSELVAYSTKTMRPIIACPDGDGVVITHGVVKCIGELLFIKNGVVSKHMSIPPTDCSN
jgi:dipeptidase E